MAAIFRNDLQILSRLRLREARLLLRARLYDGAYHIAGFAVECGFKACIARNIRRHEFPDSDISKKVFTHKLIDLVVLAGLRQQLDQRKATDPLFDANWAAVSRWNPEIRYSLATTPQDAAGLYSAIVQRNHGVLAWIRRFW